MIPEHPNKNARIGAILTLMGSLVWVQWPIDFEKFNAAALLLLIGSFVAWVSVELSEKPADEKSNDNILVDDVNKMNSLLKIIDKKQFYILKNKAIQTYMHENDYLGLLELIYFRENDIFPFHNDEIQKAYIAFAEAVTNFHHEFYTLYTSDGRGHSTWKPTGEHWVDDDVYKKIMSKIALLNNQASSLADMWESLIALSRRELKGASKALDRYEA